jgi:septal ring factor EnvC (AmiA/AmiB activator)
LPSCYNKEIDPTGRSQFGLVAEEVAEITSELVVCDKEGKPYSVRYDQVNAMLLNECLKEHRQVEAHEHRIREQESNITRLKGELDALKEQQQKEVQLLSEQLQDRAAQMQRLTAAVEMGDSTRASLVVVNRP